MIEAVVFDMDGVIVDTEQVWDEVREQLVRERGGRWHDRAQADMMGMSSPEWSAYMHDELGLAETPEEINDEVVRRMLARYRSGVPPIAIWAGIGVRDGARGPLLEGAVGWLECALAGEHDAGDHTLFLGRVERAEPGAGGPPLVRLDGDYRTA